MKAVTAIFNVAIEEEVQEVLRRCGVRHFTQWPRVVGQGPTTGPRMDNHVWPGATSALESIVEDAQAGPLMDALQALRDSPAGRQAGLYAFQTAVERALR